MKTRLHLIVVWIHWKLCTKKEGNCSGRSRIRILFYLHSAAFVTVFARNLVHALSFCDSPIAVSIITSASLMPTVSRSIYHVRWTPHSRPKIYCTQLKVKRANFFAFWGLENTTFATSKFPELSIFNYQSNLFFKFLNVSWILHEKGLKYREKLLNL